MVEKQNQLNYDAWPKFHECLKNILNFWTIFFSYYNCIWHMKSSASESTGVIILIWVPQISKKVQLMIGSASELGLNE